jgi:hypothetical protein
MRSFEFYQALRHNNLTSIASLALLGLLAAPGDCPLHGVDAFELYDPGDKQGHPYWACTARVQAVPKRKQIAADAAGIIPAPQSLACFTAISEKVRWSMYCPLAQKHRKMAPSKLLELIWKWAREVSPQEVAYDLETNRDTIQASYHLIRLDLEAYMCSLNSDVKLGGAGKVVVADVTYRSKKKRQAGGFVGQMNIGHKTAIIGMVELDSKGLERKTGRVKLLLVEGENTATMKAVFQDFIIYYCF